MREPTDSFDELWDLVEFATYEAFVIRTFLEYLRLSNDPAEKKLYRIQNWRREVASGFGNPRIVEAASAVLQTIRAVPTEVRKSLIERFLAKAHSEYFEPHS
ncbi:MAG: hypothetical protein WCD40_11385, partial [Candidatus Acidiferrales bacterium]